jgi:hypothetical protein
VALGAAGALAAGVAGCGGGDDAGSTGATSTAAAPARTASTPVRTGPGANRAPAPRATGPPWPYAQLVRSLAGRTVSTPHGRVRLDPGLLECNGEGRVMRRGGTRSWRRYTCTQTLFRGGVDRDITFEVVSVGPRRVAIAGVRYGPE